MVKPILIDDLATFFSGESVISDPSYADTSEDQRMAKGSELTQCFIATLNKNNLQLGNPSPHSVTLPSLAELSSFFNCSHMMIYDAVRGLKNHGYDYELHGYEQPIILRPQKQE